MIDVFIKYNPYKLETEVKINDAPVKENSVLRIDDARRLQEWIEDLPRILKEECNDREFKVTFHGTTLDYEDLQFVADSAKSEGIIIVCEHIPATETEDKEPVIRQIFEDIQKGPFDELRQPDLIRSFENATRSVFPVNVIATMSAGKSTLINALLCQKLMPSKNEACTATITEIKDCDLDAFKAKVYGKDGALMEENHQLTLEAMERFNSNPAVSEIDVEGNIPFVSSKDMSLVLVDTPGPNNSRDEEHKVATYRMLEGSSKTLVLYVLNAGQLSTTDDSSFLSSVAKSMSVGGKQSKDRFIFVVNKVDTFRQGEDSVEVALKNVRDYLKDNGIENPNVFPASALTALNIRTLLCDIDPQTVDRDAVDDETDETLSKIRKFNRNDELHLEDYAPLPASLRHEINSRLDEARSAKDSKTEALIHTGIIPIEAAIRMYVEKYAKTAKIKNIVDTFFKKLESTEAQEKLKKMISFDREHSEELRAKIDAISAKVRGGESAKEFSANIQPVLRKMKNGADKMADNADREVQAEIRGILESASGKLDKRQAEIACRRLEKFGRDIQAKLKARLEEVVSAHVSGIAQKLEAQYAQYLGDLSDELHIGDITIDAFGLMAGELDVDAGNLIHSLTKTEEVEAGRKWVENKNKAWWKFWTWFDESGHYETLYENREYIGGDELAQGFLQPLRERIEDNVASAKQYAGREARKIADAYEKRREELDAILLTKLGELESCTQDNKDTERRIVESTEKLNWLESIKNRVQAILKI